jgi:hypothetical protein
MELTWEHGAPSTSNTEQAEPLRSALAQPDSSKSLFTATRSAQELPEIARYAKTRGGLWAQLRPPGDPEAIIS